MGKVKATFFPSMRRILPEQEEQKNEKGLGDDRDQGGAVSTERRLMPCRPRVEGSVAEHTDVRSSKTGTQTAGA